MLPEESMEIMEAATVTEESSDKDERESSLDQSFFHLIGMSPKAEVKEEETKSVTDRPKRKTSMIISNWGYLRPVSGEGETCPVCNIQFAGKSSLSKHFKRDHPNSDVAIFSCDECYRVYKGYDCLKKHKRINHSSGPVHSGITLKNLGSKDVWRCKVCSQLFKGAYRLSMHVMIDHKDSDVHHFECDKCDQTFRTMNVLRCHKVKHNREGYNFHCDMCGIPFETHDGLVRHQNQVHEVVTAAAHMQKKKKEGILACPLCKDKFTSKKLLSAHITASHPDSPLKHFECYICNDRFRTYVTMISHRRIMHAGEKKAHLKFACELCPRKFKKWEGLRTHQAALHGGMTAVAAQLASKRDYGVQCPVCFEWFQGNHSMSDHVIAQHQDLDRKLFQCTMCNRSYRQYAHLRAHLTTKHKVPVKFTRGKKKKIEEEVNVDGDQSMPTQSGVTIVRKISKCQKKRNSKLDVSAQRRVEDAMDSLNWMSDIESDEGMDEHEDTHSEENGRMEEEQREVEDDKGKETIESHNGMTHPSMINPFTLLAGDDMATRLVARYEEAKKNGNKASDVTSTQSPYQDQFAWVGNAFLAVQRNSGSNEESYVKDEDMANEEK